MAPQTISPRTTVQAYIPIDLALKLRAHSERQRSSVSAEVRQAIQDRLADGRRP